MSKGVSDNLLAASLASENQFRMLITIFLDDMTIFLCANDTGNIVFPSTGGNTYEAVNISRSEIKTVTGTSSEERVTLTLSDPDTAVASYVAISGNKFHNKRCLIQEVSLDYLDDPADIITVFDGVMDNLKFTIGTYQIDVIRNIGSYTQTSPFMTYSPMCQWKKFKDSRCGYTGGGVTCDRTLTQCQAYGNEVNFGGHPSVPDQMVIRS